MVIASLYILVRSTRNRIVVRLRRLREPRYLFGAVIGVAYLYFAIFGPRRAASRRGRRSAIPPAATALLAAALFSRRIPQVQGMPLVAAAAVVLFLLPVAVHGYSHWTRPSSARLGLPEKLVFAVHQAVPRGAVVFSDPLTAYELAAFAPVYINAAPTTHVADTRANRPAARVKQAERFFAKHGPVSVVRRAGAHWLLVDRTRDGQAPFRLPRVYSGSRYVLYKIP